MKSIIIVIFLVFSSNGVAQWSSNTAQNNPICTETGDQVNQSIASDGTGGAIICWEDRRNSNDWNIYVQRIDSSGSILWDTNGIVVCNASNLQANPKIVEDGQGGAIIVWQDRRNGAGSVYHIYAQRIDSTGTSQWVSNGVLICDVNNNQPNLKIISDGQKGAIIVWDDIRSGSLVFGQRISSNGVVQWATNGIRISRFGFSASNPNITTDGSSGVILTWEEFNGAGGGNNILSQKINSSGIKQWDTIGVQVASSNLTEIEPVICSDGSGGVYISWKNEMNSTNYDIYAQRINLSGSPVFPLNGIPICSAASYQYQPRIMKDDSNNAIIAWTDERHGNMDIFTQKINPSGNLLWLSDGFEVITGPSAHSNPELISDNSNGFLITWLQSTAGGNAIYCQRFDSLGDKLWVPVGEVVCNASNSRYNQKMISNGSDGAIISWYDNRINPSANADVYCSRILGSGLLTKIEQHTSEINGYKLYQNYPNPFNPVTTIRFDIPKQGFVKVVVYDIMGREVSRLVNQYLNAGSYSKQFNGEEISSGLYFYKIETKNFTEVKKMIILK